MKQIKAIAATSLAIAFSFGVYIILSSIGEDNSVTVDGKPVDALFKNITLKSKNGKDEEISVKAKDVTKNGDSIELTKPTANIKYRGTTADISAKKITSDTNACHVESDVKISIFGGADITTEEINFDIKTKIAKADKKIHIQYENLDITAESYTIDINRNTIELEKDVIVKRVGDLLTSDKLYVELSYVNGSYSIKKCTANGAIRYTSKDYKCSSDGSVFFVNDIITFDSQMTLLGKRNGGSYELKSTKTNVYVSQSRDIKKVVCKNGFVLTTNGNVISGNECVFENNVVNANGNVTIKSKHGVVKSQHASYNVMSGKLNMKNTGGVLFRKDAKI